MLQKMTNNLRYFSGLTFIFSLAFFYLLYTDLSIQHFNHIWIYVVAYGSLLCISGLTLGYKDSVRNTRLDLGFQYHFITFIIVNCIGIVAFLTLMEVTAETLIASFLSILFWALGLGVHYYFSSKSIKGFDKEDIFD